MAKGIDCKRKLFPVQVADPISGSIHSPKKLKKENPIDKESGVCLLDSLTPEEIEEHLESLNPSTNKDDLHESCQLCGQSGLEFEIPPIFCSLCEDQLKGSLFWWKSAVDEDGVPYNFCNSCLKKTRYSKTISCGKKSFYKESLREGVKYVKQEEPWVRCDKCEGWQHQICGLFNPERDKEKDASYICPKCRLNELKAKHRINTPPLGAKHLPKTKLSDHIENRLRKSLALEKTQRAKALRKSLREVPEAKDLVVRVVSSVKNKLSVKKEYLDILPPGEEYPSELPYTSKVILLFQKIKGVEVCLLAIYVQEFGGECGKPNQRTVYISFIDSVKYLTPEVRTVTGESLRTFVYQEILIGYLDYCKERGFITCYIWSCPPKKGDDDYILNCHPTIQHTPKPDHLRNWYKTLLKKAEEQNVITGYTNFCKKFMATDSNKMTAARLPYYDGAYWSGFIEEEAKSMENDTEHDTGRKVRAEFTEGFARKVNSSKTKAKDAIIMHKLKKKMSAFKDDFLVVDLRIGDVSADTEDGDGMMQNDFMEKRLSYLGFCQRRNYQFDTLRRAKHTTIVTLYHLHKAIYVQPTLYEEDGELDFQIQKLCPNSYGAECNTKIKKMMQQRTLQKNKEILDVLTHANNCRAKRDKPCSYPYCVRVKSLFLHSKECNIHVAGGCQSCTKIWSLIRLHGQHCEELGCNFPHCMDMRRAR